MKSAQLRQVQAAVVTIEGTGGRGVMVPGKMIITAAHCVNYEISGEMALGDHYVEEVQTAMGRTFRLSVAAVEPVSDVAVLEAPDSEQLEDDVDAFEEFCSAVAPVTMSTIERELRMPFPVHLLNQAGTWIRGKATLYQRGGHKLWLEHDRPIKGGCSGGPVVTNQGELVGVISNGGKNGTCPHLVRALPAWIIARANREFER